MWSSTAKKSIKAEDFMTTRLYTVTPDAAVWDVVQALVKKRFSGCPVVQGRHLVGILSEQDCLRALTRAVHHRLPTAHVRDVMTTEVVSITPETELLTIADLFLQKPIKRLPVVTHGDILVGMISRRDLIAHTIKAVKRGDGDEHGASPLYLSAIKGTVPPVSRR